MAFRGVNAGSSTPPAPPSQPNPPRRTRSSLSFDDQPSHPHPHTLSRRLSFQRHNASDRINHILEVRRLLKCSQLSSFFSPETCLSPSHRICRTVGTSQPPMACLTTHAYFIFVFICFSILIFIFIFVFSSLLIFLFDVFGSRPPRPSSTNVPRFLPYRSPENAPRRWAPTTRPPTRTADTCPGLTASSTNTTAAPTSTPGSCPARPTGSTSPSRHLLRLPCPPPV